MAEWTTLQKVAYQVANDIDQAVQAGRVASPSQVRFQGSATLLRAAVDEERADAESARREVERLRDILSGWLARPFRDPRCTDVQLLISEADFTLVSAWLAGAALSGEAPEPQFVAGPDFFHEGQAWPAREAPEPEVKG